MRRFAKSFCYAFCGVVSCLKTERNMRVHFCAAFYVFMLMPFYGFTAAEKAVILLTIGSVISAEAFNTAAEAAADAVTLEKRPELRCKMISVKIYDMLRLFRFKLPAKKLNHINCEAIILPKQIDLENTVSDYSDIGLESENYSAVKAGDDPSEIFSIRDYSDGDRMSRVHWKLTAKEDRLMVKDYSLPLADSFFIAADTYIPPQFSGHSAEIYDTLAVMTTSISQLLCQNNARHIVGFFDDRSQEAEFIKVDEDGESITACVRLMMAGCCNKPSRLVNEILESGDQRRRYGHMICISAIYDAAYAEALICSGLACRYTFLICGGGADGTELAGDHANAEIVRIDPKNAAASLAALTL